MNYFRKSVPALCPDGRIRKVRARAHCYDDSLAQDTFFSVPASLVFHRRNVRGYVTGSEAGLEFVPFSANNPWSPT